MRLDAVWNGWAWRRSYRFLFRLSNATVSVLMAVARPAGERAITKVRITTA